MTPYEAHKQHPKCVKCKHSGRGKDLGGCIRSAMPVKVIGFTVQMTPAQWYERSDKGKCGPRALYWEKRT